MNAAMRFAIIHARVLSPMTANAGECAFLPVRAISKNRSRPGVESGLLRIIFEKTPGAEITPEEIRRGATRLRARNAPIQKSGVKRFSRDAWTTP